MADTIRGDFSDKNCSDCGVLGCYIYHDGPLVPVRASGFFCGPCVKARDKDFQTGRPPRPLGIFKPGENDGDLITMSVEDLRREALQLRNGIRNHRDQKGNDRCWLDDQELYHILPEDTPAETKLPPRKAFLVNCGKFWDTRQCQRR